MKRQSWRTPLLKTILHLGKYFIVIISHYGWYCKEIEIPRYLNVWTTDMFIVATVAGACPVDFFPIDFISWNLTKVLKNT